ncbi:MAG: glycosyltransferase family 2 protein, partial [Candidatus Heimdallarchaeota archaeon]|nr:glycosyltransferase family 2 protein [Candidatus Heimdallarchaeota archaeon]
MNQSGAISSEEIDILSSTDVLSFCQEIKRITDNGKLNNGYKESDSSNIDNLEHGFKLIITIPAYNEEKTIGEVIQKIREVMDQTKYCYSYFVLVVNDGSEDETVEEAAKAGAIVFSHQENKGLAETFRTEMKVCCELGAEIIVHMDADGQYKAEEIPLLIKQVENGCDLVLGSRLKGSIEHMPKINKIGNKAFSFVISLLTKQKISDGQTGFRAFTRKVAEEIQIISDHTYTQEQIIRAKQNDYSIKEVPIYFAKRNDGQSRL